MMTHLRELVLRLGLGHLGFAILLPNSPEGSKGSMSWKGGESGGVKAEGSPESSSKSSPSSSSSLSKFESSWF